MGLGKRMQSHSTPRRLILPFQIIRNDITKVKAEAIVNTANPKVAIGGVVDSAIYKAAGREKLLEARRKIGTLMPGEVATTKAFGFNAMMEKQKKTGEQAYVSTILFDDVCEVLHDRVPIDQVEKITEQEYYVRGCTALLDAVGGAIRHIGNIHKYARAEDRPDKTIFVITTDGMENAINEDYNNRGN